MLLCTHRFAAFAQRQKTSSVQSRMLRILGFILCCKLTGLLCPAANLDPPDCQLVCHVAVGAADMLRPVEEGETASAVGVKRPGRI